MSLLRQQKDFKTLNIWPAFPVLLKVVPANDQFSVFTLKTAHIEHFMLKAEAGILDA